jgi:hypothetical protein
MTADYITTMFIWLGFFAAVFFAYYFYLTLQSKERTLLIEKGIDISEFYKKNERLKFRFKFLFPWFTFGLMILGIGIGVVLDLYIRTCTPNFFFEHSARHNEPFIIGSVTIFGALGLISGRLLDRYFKLKDRNNDYHIERGSDNG